MRGHSGPGMATRRQSHSAPQDAGPMLGGAPRVVWIHLAFGPSRDLGQIRGQRLCSAQPLRSPGVESGDGADHPAVAADPRGLRPHRRPQPAGPGVRPDQSARIGARSRSPTASSTVWTRSSPGSTRGRSPGAGPPVRPYLSPIRWVHDGNRRLWARGGHFGHSQVPGSAEGIQGPSTSARLIGDSAPHLEVPPSPEELRLLESQWSAPGPAAS